MPSSIVLHIPASAKRWFKETWPDLFNLTIGAWMIGSAFFPSWSGPPEAAWAAGLSGAAVVALSIAAMLRIERWKEATNLALGIWLMVAPWILGFADQPNPFWNFLLDGLLLAVHAAYQMHRARGRGRVEL